ncbi:MAG: slipin family protein [Kiloniellales bacterium]|nr:slipin family protein [Kiloniellales bacterium]
MWKTVRIAEHELGLLYRDRVFQALLEPGVHRQFRGVGQQRVVTLDLRRTPVIEPALETLYRSRPALVEARFAVADVADAQVALVYADGRLVDVVGPGKIAFYSTRLRSIAIELVDAQSDYTLARSLVAPLARLDKRTLVAVAVVPSDHVGLLYVDGVLERQLTPGLYAFLKAVRRIDVVTLDLRLQSLEVTGQEVLTRDRIGIRANVTGVYRILDPVKAVSVAADLRDYLYKELQFALRQAVGTRTLEEVLGDKQSINAALAERLLPKLESAGLEAASVGIKDIILPGEVRELMNRVIEAEKTAQANVIKRREETAATRSLLNTAKLMEDNPLLLRLKELEALEKVSEKVGNVIVGNGMDGVLEDLVRIKPRSEA